MVRAFIVLTLLVTFYFAIEARAECDTVFKGCNIRGKQCECGHKIACTEPWQFPKRKQCLNALFGDTCKHEHCKNGGVCVQKKTGDGFQCQCAGTGFFGQFCENSCPLEQDRKLMDIPTACVVP